LIEEAASMRTLSFIALVVFFTAMFGTAVSKIVASDDEQARNIAIPILDNILAGYETHNYTKYSKDFSESLRSVLPEEKFKASGEQIEKVLGKYESREYLGFLNREGLTLVLWKGRFEKAESDILIKLTLSKNGRKNEVEGLYFQ
jgi:hypothetical protein